MNAVANGKAGSTVNATGETTVVVQPPVVPAGGAANVAEPADLAPTTKIAQALAGLTALLESGALMHNIAARLPLDRIAEAHELVESGKAVGNVVLSVSGE